jgi:NTE family protein
MNQPAADAPVVILALQGGGALGAYQAGVFQSLTEHDVHFDWIIGTSIGAFNGAIIAGNPPERRLARLRDFWHGISREGPLEFAFPMVAPALQPLLTSAAMTDIFVNGVPGFFTPRKGLSWDPTAKAAPDEVSYYETSELARTLEQLIDFDYLNSAVIRYTIGAVKVNGGEWVQFDNTRGDTLTPHHVMASGALPPGFPPVKVEGELYWDGGVYSNTPIDVALDDDERRDMLCFSVDLWAPEHHLPSSIAEVLNQEKNIRYASRSGEHMADHQRIQNLRRAVRLLGERLTKAQLAMPEVKELLELGRGGRMDIVRLIQKELPDDNYFKDVDFRRVTVEARWRAGYADAQRAVHNKSWLNPLPPEVGLAIHELSQMP